MWLTNREGHFVHGWCCHTMAWHVAAMTEVSAAPLVLFPCLTPARTTSRPPNPPPLLWDPHTNACRPRFAQLPCAVICSLGRVPLEYGTSTATATRYWLKRYTVNHSTGPHPTCCHNSHQLSLRHQRKSLSAVCLTLEKLPPRGPLQTLLILSLSTHPVP